MGGLPNGGGAGLRRVGPLLPGPTTLAFATYGGLARLAWILNAWPACAKVTGAATYPDECRCGLSRITRAGVERGKNAHGFDVWCPPPLPLPRKYTSFPLCYCTKAGGADVTSSSLCRELYYFNADARTAAIHDAKTAVMHDAQTFSIHDVNDHP